MSSVPSAGTSSGRMRLMLPAYLVHSILLLSHHSHAQSAASLAESSSSTAASLASSLSSSGSSEVQYLSLPTGRPLTLWDIGFSLREQWADLREEEECPVPPDLAPVEEPAESASPATSTSSEVVPSSTESSDTAEKTADDFVSFEEWKKLHEAEEEESSGEDDEPATPSHDTEQQTLPTGLDEGIADLKDGNDSTTTSQVGSSAAPKGKTSGEQSLSSGSASSKASSSGDSSSAVKSPALSAHVHSKYNYASPDCSARIHSSSDQTQHASSLLHKSRDRYMLTPCKADEHWVVIELCDEIRIEALEIAVWEFFSGIVRDVRVSVGGAEDDDELQEAVDDGEVRGRNTRWKEVGAFIGKNVRGVQTFILNEPTSFHRFIRLDFPSYYGSEYYCPVSQVKVYGMNQMEAFKWEQKRLSASSKHREKPADRDRERENEERKARERAEDVERARKLLKEEDEKREKELDELERLLGEQARRSQEIEALTDASMFDSISSAQPATTSVVLPKSSPAAKVEPRAENTSTTSTTTTSTTSASGNDSQPPTGESVLSQASSGVNATTSSPAASSSSAYTRAAPPRSDSSESIYAFIIRRLNALEGNSTLVARYIEEQTKIMRALLGRVERSFDDFKTDLDTEQNLRWDTERMRQEDRLGRVLSQMEQQRLSLEAERRAILSQLRIMGDELGYERRRGLAQLFIMLVIIVLGAATRSSSIDAILKPLIAEAKRRRSVYVKRRMSGPLTGLKIDMGAGRPPAVIGLGRPGLNSASTASGEAQSPLSPTVLDSPSPSPVAKISSKTPSGSKTSLTTSSSIRRPHTPGMRNRRSLAVPTPFRSFSATLAPSGDPSSSVSLPNGLPLLSPSPGGQQRPRQSLPPRAGVVPRRLARSAHLHTIAADHTREKIKQDVVRKHAKTVSISDGVESFGPEGWRAEALMIDDDDGGQTPRRPGTAAPLDRGASGDIRPVPGGSPRRHERASSMADGVEVASDWDTDVDASASEVEDAVGSSRPRPSLPTLDTVTLTSVNGGGHGFKSTSAEDVIQELADIWEKKS